MTHSFFHAPLVGVVLLVGMWASAAHTQHVHGAPQHLILPAGSVVWQDAPTSLPEGAQAALITGDPSAPGAFTLRIRVPAGYRVPPHWHSGVEHLTVLSGDLSVRMGEEVDRTAGERLDAGSFMMMPRGTPHYVWTEGGATIQLHGLGPWGITYVDPADDPRGAAASQAGEADLAGIRRATERFRDVNVALAEGYIPDPSNMCITSEMEGLPRQEGAMGIHYLRPDLLEITAVEPRVNGTGVHTDFTRPGVLIYEPKADGSLELVAIENLVWAGAWRAAGNNQAPSFMGHDYYRMIDNPLTEDIDEAHGFEPHYELHMWLFRENPNGLFAQFNPSVTCEHHVHAH